MAFETRLVGVLPDDSVGPTLSTWTWQSTYTGTASGGGIQTSISQPTDGSGTGGITITSIDDVPQVPPSVTCTATPTTLWPPNGKAVVVTISGNITAGTSALAATTYVVKDEYGEDQPGGNVNLGAGSSYLLDIPLVAARNGDDLDGRTYTINILATDTLGNASPCSAVITVPHDQR